VRRRELLAPGRDLARGVGSAGLAIEQRLAHDRLRASRTNADQRGADPDEILERLDVVAAASGQLFPRGRAADVFVPARERLVDGLDLLELDRRRRNLGRAAVADTDLQLLHRAQDVQLREREVRDAVQTAGVAREDRVEPTAAPRPSRSRPELGASVAETVAVFTEELGGKGSRAHARGVGLRDAHDGVERAGADA